MEFSDMSISQLWDYSNSEDQEARAYALAWLSCKLGENGDYSTAISTGISGADLFNELENDYMEGECHYYTGLAQYSSGDYAAAIQVLDKAGEMYRSTHDESQIGRVILTKARCFSELNLSDSAVETLFEAQKLFESAENWTMSGIALLEAGELIGQNSSPSEALAIFQKALSGFRLVGDLVGAGRAHDRMAEALVDLGSLDEALDNLREAYNVFEYIDDLDRKTYAEFRLGWTLVRNGNNQEAIPFLESAVVTYKVLGDFGRAANSDVVLSHAHRGIGNSVLADEMLEKSTTIFRSLGMREDALINEINIAFYMRNSDIEKSLMRFRQIMEQTSELKSFYLWNSTAIRLAETLSMKSDVVSIAESLSILEGIDVASIGEDITTLSRYLHAYSWALYLNGKSAEAKVPCQKLIDLGVSSSLTFETAEAHRLLGYIAKDENDASYPDLFSRSVALYLSAGLDEDARELSTWFLPQSKRRQDTLYSEDSDLPETDFEEFDDSRNT